MKRPENTHYKRNQILFLLLLAVAAFTIGYGISVIT